MRAFHALLVISVLASLAGCTGPMTVAGGVPDAEVRPSGPEVFVNGTRITTKRPLGQNASVSTGPLSSALVAWDEGTTVQLDEASDPIFVWNEELLAVNLGFGWFLIDTGTLDVRIENDLADAVAGSRVVIHIVPGERFEAYLLEGSFRLIRPPGRTLGRNQKVAVTATGRIEYGSITPRERQLLERRFERWEFAADEPTRPTIGLGGVGPRIFGAPGGGIILRRPRDREPSDNTDDVIR